MHFSHARLDLDPKANMPKGLWPRVARFAKPHYRQITVFLSTVIVGAALGLVPPLIFMTLIDKALPNRDLGLLNILALAAVGLAVVTTAVDVVGRWVSARIGEGVIFDLRTALFDRIQRMPIAFFTRSQTGSLVSRLNNDVVGAQSALTGTLGGIVSNAITLVLTLAVMFKLEWRLTFLSLVVMPIFVLPSKLVGQRLRVISRRSMELNASMNTTMTERFNVAGALVVKLFGNHDAERDGFADSAGQVRDIGIRRAILARLFYVALALVGAVGIAVVYWVGGHRVLAGAFTIGQIVAFADYSRRVYDPLSALTNARVDLMATMVSFERVFEIMDLPQAIADAPDAQDLAAPRGAVSFNNVSFRYPDDAHVVAQPVESLPVDNAVVLRDVSFTIEPGQMIALVGPSGAGKSTIASLVPRLYDVTGGSITFDGRDVRGIRLSSLASAVGVVSQDPHLFHDTVRANLRYARPAATDEELWAACRAAHIDNVIAALPEGLGTIVGERGYRMSGGEKQRLALARVILKDPALVILDEATSHLDSESEAAIQAALAEVLKDRSSLVIAHRLSTVVAADAILVLDNGTIVERGPHSELLARGGLYASLYHTQFAATT